MRDSTNRLIESYAALSAPDEFALSPDGHSIAFTQTAGHHRQIFALPLDGGLARRIMATLDDCGEPQWSPDGQWLVFIREHALWMAHADGTHARVLIDHATSITTPRWSPDGSRIAFLSRRRGWTQLWSVARGSVRPAPITPAGFDVANPVWSPDSKWLAYDSWRAEDIQTRGVYLIPSTGGAEQMISPRHCWSGAPGFSPDSQTLALVSDQAGWFHIYLFDLQSRITRQLTHGECEDGGSHFYDVDPRGGPVFSPDGKQIAFIRHRAGKFDVWMVDVASGEARRLSSHDGHYRIVGWEADSKQLVVTFDNAATPGDVYRLSLDGTATQVFDSAIAEIKSHASAPEWVAYTSHDGLTIPAALYRPLEQAPAPAIVFIHGGPNSMFGEFYIPLPQILAHEGYVVLLPNYRGSTGYGNTFRNANMREWGNADALDIVAAARWLRRQPFVDPEHIAVVGPSYGGYLTLCALTLAPEFFCAGVDMYGDSELAQAYRREDREARMDLARHMGTPEENPAGYRRGSPIYRAEQIRAPLLILHGKDDLLVVPRMSEKMIEAMRIENKQVESHFYKGEEHGFFKPENKKDAWERIVNFLNRYCKDDK